MILIIVYEYLWVQFYIAINKNCKEIAGIKERQTATN
jgi:hypothetical protein